MDGWITIGTQLKTDKFDRQVADLENQIKREEEKQQLNIGANTELEEEYARATKEVEELTKQYTQAANEADRLQRIISRKNAPIISQERLDYDEQVRKLDELNAKLEEASTKQSKLGDKVAKSNIQYQSSVDKIEKLNGRISDIHQKQQAIDLKKQQAQLKEAEKSIANMQKGITGAIGKIGKMALAVLSVRSAYMMVRQASSTLAQYNEQYATDLEYMRFVLAQGLAPVLEKVVQLAQTLMAYINYLAQRLLGVNLFAKGSADAFKKAKDNMGGMAKSSKEIKNNLASFDELNILDSSADAGATGGGALAPSLDIGGLEDVEIPEWLENIGNYFEGIREHIKGINDDTTGLFANIGSNISNIQPKVEKTFKPWSDLTVSLLNTGIKPALNTIQKVFADLWVSIQKAWDKWAAPIFDNFMLAIESIGTILLNVWNSFFKPIWENFMDAVDWLWTMHLKPLWDNLLDLFGEIINGILEIWNKVLTPLINWFVETFGPVFADVLNTVINIWGSIFGTIADVVNGIITSLKGVIQFIVGVFTGDWEKAWQGIKNFFQGIWDGMVGIVKGAINIVIDLVNGLMAVLEKGLNWVIDKINSLEIVNPFTGDEIWSPNVPRVKFDRIPKLAKGGIINTPTRAVVGEQGREAVLPLENNTEWMDTLAEKLNTRGGDITIRFTGSTAQLVRMLKPELEKEDKRTGRRLIVGGAY